MQLPVSAMDQEAVCIGVCQIDPDTDRCIGCGRTSDEIFGPDQDPADGAERKEDSP